MDLEEFRFETKAEYEQELARLIAEIGRRRQVKAKIAQHESKYEGLLEEYMKFCSNGDPKNGE